MSTVISPTQKTRTTALAAVFVAVTGLVLLILPYAIRNYAMMGLLAVAAAAVVLIMVSVHPLVPFGMYYCALFFADTNIPGFPISVNQGLGALFLASWLSRLARQKATSADPLLLGILALLAAYFLPNAALGENLERGLVHARYVVIYFALAIALATSLSSERSILALAWIVTIASAAAAITGIVEAIEKDILNAFAGHWGSSVRIRGTAKNPIVYGWNLVYAFPFAFLLFAEMRSRYTRMLSLGLGCLSLFTACLTFNRQTYIVTVIILGLCGLLYQYRNRRLFVGLIGLGAVAGTFTILPLMLQRLLTLTTLARDYSYLERRDSFLISMNMIREHPIFGIGLGSYPAVWKDYVPTDGSTFYVQYMGANTLKFPDMGYMELLAEGGIIGLSLFVLLIATILVRCYGFWRQAVRNQDPFARNYSATVLTLTLFVAITTMIQDTLLYPRLWLLFAMALLLNPKIIPIRQREAVPSSPA